MKRTLGWWAVIAAATALLPTGLESARAALNSREAREQFSPCGVEPNPVLSLRSLIASCGRAAHEYTPPENRAWALYQRGLYYQFDHQYDRAIADYTSAIGIERNDEDAYAARADAYEQSGDHAHAQADYAQAATMKADNADALNGRCWARAIRGFPLDKALADCTASLALQPDDPSAFDSRCLVNYRLGNYAAAISDCNENLKRNPGAAGSLYVRGLAKLKSGDADGGNADLKAASDADWRIAKFYAFWGVQP